jgi:phage-related protein
VDEKGRAPVDEFLSTQPKHVLVAFKRQIDKYLIPNGPNIRGNKFHPVEEFNQLRFADHYRVLMYQPEQLPRTFIFLHAFKKKGDDTPQGEILKARTKMNRHQSELNKLIAEEKKK